MATALTDIKYGDKTITAGSSVRKEDFDEADWSALVEVGAVAESASSAAPPTKKET
mgnify:CR=1 FL=1